MNTLYSKIVPIIFLRGGRYEKYVLMDDEDYIILNLRINKETYLLNFSKLPLNRFNGFLKFMSKTNELYVFKTTPKKGRNGVLKYVCQNRILN